MKKTILSFMLLFILPVLLPCQPAAQDIARWKQEAARVTIIRDTWGIPHVYGRTDADAAFGLLYAQCEDDFQRVEMNYIVQMGRRAEVEGESALAADLYFRLLIDPAEAQADYERSPQWLKALLDAYADGINYYLYTHPSVKPKLLDHFEPWFPLTWTDGSIGAISTGNIRSREVGQLYLGGSSSMGDLSGQPGEPLAGSNGFALAPSRTASGNSILYINPHVTFYFRPEVHAVSEEGLNAYGAVTWGQFFIYQGFNEHCGWMHTSSRVDVSDMYIEKIVERKGRLFYQYDGREMPVTEKRITLRYASGDTIASRTVTAYFTHHGPVMAKRDGQWLSVRSYNRALQSLIQSFQRTKSKGFEDYKKAMDLTANTSNNTVFADDKGNIAYWHGNYVPKRDPSFDWSQPVDGTDPATEWQGLHTVEEAVHIYNPASGWIQNCNSTPFTASGESSPKREDYPTYMAPDGQNFRGINASRLLKDIRDVTLDKIIATAYDPTLTAFELLVPALVRSFDENVTTDDSLYVLLKGPIDVLRKWDFACSKQSVATTLANTWGQLIYRSIWNTTVVDGQDDVVGKTKAFAATAGMNELVVPLLTAVRSLEDDFGAWKIPWGDINRYQRLDGSMKEHHDDTKPSLPVGFASSRWGMLAAYSSRTYDGTKKLYGYGGASFIAAVEFGPKLKAKSLLTGGESGDPSSKHFSDQAEMYTKGKFKDVLFYKDDVLKHAEASYHPGEGMR